MPLLPRASGITNGRVYRKAENPNDVVILVDVADVAKARVWAAGEFPYEQRPPSHLEHLPPT